MPFIAHTGKHGQRDRNLCLARMQEEGGEGGMSAYERTIPDKPASAKMIFYKDSIDKIKVNMEIGYFKNCQF